MRRNKPLFALLFACAAIAAVQTDPVAAVTGGRIRGRLTPDGGAAFKGIPYAQPPLADLRWRPPQPVKPWTDIREADKFSLACTQLSEGWNARDAAASGEDCLYLNVAAPQWPPKSKHPVFVWIHGGSNTAGSGIAAGFDQRTLVKRGLVLVTINYRMGALGFLTHPELTRESRHHASGNYGLMDQLATLKWVHDNIGKFGGDAGNVTVAGQSAGAFDISLLLTSPLAKGLFRRAIVESGAVSGFKGSMTQAYAEDLGKKLAARLKAPAGDAMKTLRTLPALDILTAGRAVNADRWGLETLVDGWVLPKSPTEVFAAGASLPVPLITGSNAVETGGNMPAARLRDAIQKVYGSLADRALALYGLAGSDERKPDPLYGPPGAQWSTDTGFRCPSTQEALGHAAGGRVTYQYEFEQPPPGRPATAHASELNFLFGWGANVQLTPAIQKDSEQMQAYWTNFARTGDPNGEGLPRWPKFTAQSQDYLAFTSEGAAAKAGMRRDICTVFVESLKAQGGK
jgi:para-nitrobenzyl esterase